jgi:hypothetical protein
VRYAVTFAISLVLATVGAVLVARDPHSTPGIWSAFAGLPGALVSLLWSPRGNTIVMAAVNTLFYFGLIEGMVALMKRMRRDKKLQQN